MVYKISYNYSVSVSVSRIMTYRTTPNPDATSHHAEYLRNGARYRHSYNEILIETHTCPTQRCQFE